MPAAMTSAITRTGSVATARPSPQIRGARFVGLVVASFVPAVFWSALIAAVAIWCGAPLAPATIAFTCAAITAFLAAVCAPFVLRGPL